MQGVITQVLVKVRNGRTGAVRHVVGLRNVRNARGPAKKTAVVSFVIVGVARKCAPKVCVTTRERDKEMV